MIDKMCSSSACLSVLNKIEIVVPGDCKINGVQVISEVVDPILEKCASIATGSASATGFVESSSSSTSSTIRDSGSDKAISSEVVGEGAQSISAETIVGITLGALATCIIMVIALIVIRRRRQNKSSMASDFYAMESNEGESPCQRKSSSSMPQPNNYQETTATTSKSTATHSSHGTESKPSQRPGGGIWEDPLIIAARVPFGRIKIGDLLGKGAYGEVYRGKFHNQQVAIKRLLPDTRKNMTHIESFLTEIKLLASLEHPHVVQFVGVAWDSLLDLMCLTEFMDGGDLRSLLMHYEDTNHEEGFDLEKTGIALEVAHALTYLHSLKPMVLHRDLKSRNILLTNSLQAKLTDFGISRAWTDRTMTAGVGSMLWMAPEVMMGTHYDEKADVFSLGVVMSELDTHQLPYSNTKDARSGALLPGMAVLQLVSSGRLTVKLSDKLIPSMRALIEKCVSVNPEDRPTAAQVLYELQLGVRSQK